MRFPLTPLLLVGLLSAAEPPPELGQVSWNRDFEAARALAVKQGKPLLVLFQEVPGCATCRNYGQNVLSHPQLVEALDTLVVPVAVYNNQGGNDRKVLESFREPAWNNPVLRVLDPSSGKPLAPRLAGNYTRLGLAQTVATALRAAEREVPAYLDLLVDEWAGAAEGRTAVFAMGCFWTGEGALGGIDGVTATRPGFLGGREVVEVTFLPKRVSERELKAKAEAARCSHVGEESSGIRPDREPQYYLSRTPLRFLPLTGLQASRVNAALAAKQDYGRYLSPRQVEAWQRILARPDAGWPEVHGLELAAAWKRTDAVLRKKTE